MLRRWKGALPTLGKKGESSEAVDIRPILSVCVVEYNPLAARFLGQILASHALRIYTHNQVLDCPFGFEPEVEIFILDRSTLPEPLSRFLRSLRVRFPEARTVVLDHNLPAEELQRLLFLGVQGFLSYTEVEKNLPEAIRAVAAGELWVPPEVLHEYQDFSARLTRKTAALTAREQRIVELIQRRMSNKEISGILKIPQKMVRSHLESIFLKLGVRHRDEVADMANTGRLPNLRAENSN